VNARRCGVRFEHGLDVVTMRNVEVWNYVPELLSSCTGFHIGHVDEIRLSNCAVVAAAVGFHFVETKRPPDGKPGRVWGGMENCSVDFSGVAVKIDTASVLRIHGGSLWAHHFGVVVDGVGDVLISGADIRANSHHCLHVKGGDSLTVSGCLLKKNSKGGEQQPKVLVDGGKSLAISGCTFDEKSAGIRLAPGARRVAITGNVFAEMPFAAIVDDAKDAKKIIANNLMDTTK
jgi:polygalacturonase